MNAPHGREAELFELDPAICTALLRAQPVGRLVLGGSEAQVVPVDFVVVDDGVAFRTATDRDRPALVTRIVPWTVPGTDRSRQC